MFKNFWLKITLFFLLLAGGIAALGFYTQPENSSPRCESMDECSVNKQDDNGQGEMIWETISHQFIFSARTGY